MKEVSRTKLLKVFKRHGVTIDHHLKSRKSIHIAIVYSALQKAAGQGIDRQAVMAELRH